MQLLTRSACRLGKSFCTNLPWLRPELASLQHVPCRVSTPQQEQRRHGTTIHEDAHRERNPLYQFWGTWHEKDRENFTNFLEVVGAARPLFSPLLKRKMEIIYRQRDDGEWEKEMGFRDSPLRFVSTIVFNQQFDYGEIGIPVVCTMTPDGKSLRELIETYEGPRVVISVQHKVSGKKMTIGYRANNVVLKRFFQRVA
ncbi:unnamed protein product [Candidula unifasciata]|uniref:Uncharacterized protein n=1 Tax=Candidula unifasciata TaxID=100452 RepID=A0A8S3ZRE5_9EUPU|nr:unnamed protein product [Candidula unifasciata]